MREIGEGEAAARELSEAFEDAIVANERGLAANIKLSWAFDVARLGDVDRALVMLSEAENDIQEMYRGRLRCQVGTLLFWRGDLAEAAETLVLAAEESSRHRDGVSEVRSRANLGSVLSQLGRYEDARAELERAANVADQLGISTYAAVVSSNIGYIATLQGDLPAALAAFADAEASLSSKEARGSLPRILADHAQALADAALFHDADEMLRRALAMFDSQGQLTELAGGMLTAAEVRLANGDAAGAVEAAERAAASFSAQGRVIWAAVASGLALHARSRLEHSAALARDLMDAADVLDAVGWAAEATRSRLLAGKVAAEEGATDRSVIAQPTRRAVERARPADRILLAHVDALVARNRGGQSDARRAITRGLDIAMSAQSSLGSIEMRAHAAVHGYALTELGARLAVEEGRPRELLARIEATRLMASRVPDVRPPEDTVMASMLTELRSLNATIADPSSTDEQRHDAERARSRVERDVRRRSRTVRGDVDANVRLREELGSALAMLGERQLLAHAALDGRLLAVSVVGNRARLHDLGSLEDVSDQLDGIAFSLHRLNRSQGSDASRDAAAEMLYVMTDELAELLLPPIVRDAMNPVVVVPTAALHDVPWGLLPPLGGRAVSVNPSVSAWARAERTRQERATARTGLRSIGFMAGPGLDFAEFEVENLSKLYIDPEVYVGRAATSDACVDLLGRADVVHIACHGSFRTDNPMFSSLHLADGPVIVHDLERLHRLPETVILPACSVGTTKALQGGSLLGLAAALTTLGACNVIAPLTPINDAASVTVMDRLHHELIAGSSPAAALAIAALEHDLTDPTAGAFITLGA